MQPFAALLSLSLSAPPPALDALADAALKAWNTPGLAIALVQDGKSELIARGLREIGKPHAITIDDVFPLASCTKAVTAALVAKLADEGKLAFDDPVRRHLPVFHLSDPNADALVALKDLLTHRTGVNGHDLLWYRSKLRSDEIITCIGKLPLNEPFRGAYQYSTLMYMAAGKAAANANGTTWEDAVRVKLFEPLGITNITFTTTDPAFTNANKASGHRLSQSGELEIMPRYEVKEPNPAGSINLAPRQMIPWLKYLLAANGNLAVTQSPQIVIPLPAAAKRFHPDTIQLAYGMGWIISDYRGLKVLSHGGMIDGFRTLVVLVPERKLAFAIFANLHDSKMVLALANSIIDRQLNLDPKDWNAIFLNAVAAEKAERKAAWQKLLDAKDTLKPQSLKANSYSGDYENEAYGNIAIKEMDGKLRFSWSSFDSPLDYWGDDAFRIASGFLQDQFLEFAHDGSTATAIRFQNLIFRKK